MNTPTIEDQLRSHYLSKADELRLPPLEFDELLEHGERGVVVAITSAPRARRGSWWVAAAAVAALTVGGVAVIQGRHAPSDTTAASQPSEPSHSPATASTVGLFPAGNVAAVVSAAYETPAAVATAYLADRTSVANLPSGFTATATTGNVVSLDATHALVSFYLQAADDGSDGFVQVEQVQDPNGSTGWVVTAASVASMELTNLSYVDGNLLGSFTARWGTTEFTILDASTGAALATHEGTPVPPEVETPGEQPIDISGLAASSIIVRAWRTPTATFSETLLHDGQQGVAGGWTPLESLAVQPTTFEGSPVSALAALTPGEVITADAPVGVTVQVSLADGKWCLAGSLGEVSGSGCFEPETIALGTASISLDPDADGRVLVAGIVPDEVGSISEGSTIIQPTQNIWFTVTDTELHTFVIASADGKKSVDLTIDN